jgi:hypothetical protein
MKNNNILHNIKINVTKDNVARACQKNSHCCMIADAVRDRFKWATFIEVDVQSIRFNDRKKGIRYIYLTPVEAQKAIILFDQGIKVSPFSFHLSQGFMKTRVMRARHKIAKKHSREYKRNPNKKTPSFHREFGIRGLTK